MTASPALIFFAKYIESELGIIYAEENYFQLQNRLEEATKRLGYVDVASMYEASKATVPVALKELLLDLATNNETSFFRDQKIFKAIGKVVLNAVSGNALNTRRLDIWSAASSTGQEAISLSILINEYNLSAKDKVDYSILATDISERVLSRAKDATYTQLEVQRGLSEALLAKYFQRIEDRFQAKSEIRRHIEFKKLNLKEAFPFSQKFHLVLCRNVLIYQNVERKKDILNRIAATLVPRGFLVLGSGESLLGVSSDFESENVDGAIIYRKKT